MGRPWNLAPSGALVLIGAWASGGRSLAALGHLSVWGMAAVSAAMAMASCLVNDYFDFAAGIDGINTPTKPLPSGAVTPEHAVLVGGSAYIVVLLATSLISDARVRFVIAASAVATLLYTPVLKRISFVKNAAVAGTIAAAPLAGALAAGAAGASLRVVTAPCAFLFLAVCYREILMDVTDAEGDAAAGVKTLPVVLGRELAVGGVGTALLAACAAMLLTAALHGSGLAWAWAAQPRWEVPVRAVSAVVGALTVARPLVAAVRLQAEGFPAPALAAAVDGARKTIGAGIVLLALMA